MEEDREYIVELIPIQPAHKLPYELSDTGREPIEEVNPMAGDGLICVKRAYRKQFRSLYDGDL